ncbi:MAG: hypothetical protein SNJ76_04155 [Fimbriimonadaceae bacterium]
MAKISRPIVYTAVLGAVAYGVVVLTEPDTPNRTTRPRPAATAPSNARTSDLIQPEDFSASFPRLLGAPRDSFRPLVVRASGTNPLAAARLDAVPAAFAGGDPNWRYTGNASIDGVSVALLENDATGDGVFLRVGEAWKRSVLTAIEQEAIVLTGPGGAVRRVRLGIPEFEDPTAGPAGVAPLAVNPPLQGPIGGDFPGVRTNADTGIAVVPTAENNNFDSAGQMSDRSLDRSRRRSRP